MVVKKIVYQLPSFIGDTPLVPLRRIFKSRHGITVYAKLELCSVGGSMKDRAAFNMVQQALLKKAVRPGDAIIESSSGNMGIGLALACKYYGLQFTCVIDERTSEHTVDVLQSLGANIVRVSSDDLKGGETLLEGRLRILKHIVETQRNVYWTNQYANPANSEAYAMMMEEICARLGKEPDYIFCATGTCGTIRGCSDHIQKAGLHTKVIAVDAIGSVIFGGKPEPRLLPGHGAALKPDLFRGGMCEEVIHINEKEAVTGCHKLRDSEAIFAGGSSGAIISALEKMYTRLSNESTVVLILPDRGERYLSTIYDASWVKKHIISTDDTTS